MELSTQYMIAPNVSWREHGGKLIIIDMGSGECFELNETGTEIWRGIEKGAANLAIAMVLAQKHGLTLEAACQHVTQHGTQLIQRGLITAVVQAPL